ncbi:MAG: hypothetical protein IAF08_15015 [Rhizobacter sp.]|nr:hypothetical protein [Chlorobiales bacterium]
MHRTLLPFLLLAGLMATGCAELREVSADRPEQGGNRVGDDAIYITLAKDSAAQPVADYYIKDVIDDRKASEVIGIAQVGLFNSKIAVKLEGGLRAQLLSYFDARRPVQPNLKPIVIRVLSLNVVEYPAMFSEKAQARIRLAFYALEGSQLSKLYETDAFVEIFGFDVAGTHESNLRTVINQCLASFDSSNRHSVQTVMQDSAQVYPRAPDSAMSAASQPARSFAFIMGGGVFGTNGIGGTLRYATYYDRGSDWFMPISYSLTVLSIQNRSRGLQGIFTNLGISVGGIKRPDSQSNGGFFVEVIFPFGTESINSKNSLFVGLGSTQNFISLPRASGFAFSIGLFENVHFNSRLYPWDVGLRVQLGGAF